MNMLRGKIKVVFTALWIGLLLLNLKGPALASTVDFLTITTPTPVLMFDSDGGGVDLFIDNTSNYGFGTLDGATFSLIVDSGSFIFPPHNFAGGPLSNFAISNSDGSIIIPFLTGSVTQTYTNHFESYTAAGAPVFDHLVMTWEDPTDFTGHITLVSLLGGGDGMTPTPIPPSVWLMGAGLLGLVGLSRRKHSLSEEDH